MEKKYTITEEQKEEIKKARKKNKDKRAEKKLKAIEMRAEGYKLKEISEKTGYHAKHVSKIVVKYIKEGIEAIIKPKYGQNRRNMSYEEEAEIIKPFIEKAEKGQIVEVAEIKKVYQEAVGHEIGSGQIYRVLRRHKWRKVMPRSKHPKKAKEEDIEASKKLNLKS